MVFIVLLLFSGLSCPEFYGKWASFTINKETKGDIADIIWTNFSKLCAFQTSWTNTPTFSTWKWMKAGFKPLINPYRNWLHFARSLGFYWPFTGQHDQCLKRLICIPKALWEVFRKRIGLYNNEEEWMSWSTVTVSSLMWPDSAGSNMLQLVEISVASRETGLPGCHFQSLSGIGSLTDYIQEPGLKKDLYIKACLYLFIC